MKTIDEKQLNEFVAAAHKAGSYGLMRCSSGNLSWRIDDEHMLISASRSWLAEITPDQVALCRIADGAVLNGKRPSVETGFHAGVLQARSDVNVVLHFQSPYATTITCGQPENVNFFVLPEMAYYIGTPAVLPYLTPGSAELAEAVTEAMTSHDLAILRNHGQITAGCDFNDAIQKAVFFEMVCEVIHRGGNSIQPLTPEAIEQLRPADGQQPTAV
ncbi:MAG: class II aldolase/adducin family protein [Phycisphaerae bacterium]|nr:class II aldolase/adducin family protein [Phycisphaerae bacterium]